MGRIYIDHPDGHRLAQTRGRTVTITYPTGQVHRVVLETGEALSIMADPREPEEVPEATAPETVEVSEPEESETGGDDQEPESTEPDAGPSAEGEQAQGSEPAED